MKIGDLSQAQAQMALRTETGLTLSIGPFKVRLISSLPAIAQGIHNLYFQYPVELEAEYSDFQIRIFCPLGLRRWYRPQVFFSLDEHVPFKPLPYNQAFAFFEWGLNWCVAQYFNTALILHAAVVERDGQAAILPAPPGSGKSTLCAALVCHGWRLLSDEMAIIDLQSGELIPLPRPVSLKNESISIMRDFAKSHFISAPTFDTNKGTVAHMRAPDRSVVDSTVRARPTWIVLPNYQHGSSPQLEKLPPARAFMTAVENSFNYSVLGLPAYQRLLSLVNRVQCFRFTYSRLGDAIESFQSLSMTNDN